MGMSPTELSAVLARLQSEGLPLEVRSDRQVRLRAALDLTVASRVHPHLSANRLGRRYYHYLRVGSTNDTARRLAEAGAPEGTTVVAEEQTRGRGRLGRAWLSRKAKDLLLSLVLRPAVDPAQAPGLSLMVGLAVSQAIREVAGIPADLKWPNDVLTRGGKCCGVLTEMSAEPGKIHFVIVGVGINVNGVSLPEAIAGQASTLARAGGLSDPQAKTGGVLSEPSGSTLPGIPGQRSPVSHRALGGCLFHCSRPQGPGLEFGPLLFGDHQRAE